MTEKKLDAWCVGDGDVLIQTTTSLSARDAIAEAERLFGAKWPDLSQRGFHAVNIVVDPDTWIGAVKQYPPFSIPEDRRLKISDGSDIQETMDRYAIDGVTVTVGKRIVVTKDNAEQYREVLGDELAALTKESDDSRDNGVYEVTSIGHGPCVLTRQTDSYGLPRWWGQVKSIIGSYKMKLANALYFRDRAPREEG